MGFGLQCWDENGNLVVDTSDYNCRYIRTYNVETGSGNSVTQSVSGINASNAYAVIVAGFYGSVFNEAVCGGSDNAFTLFTLSGYGTSQTFTVEVYRYA